MAKPKQIKSVSQSKKVSLLVYSDPGVGKTRLAGTTPVKSLILRPPVDHTDSIDNTNGLIDEWILDSWNEAWEALDYARGHAHEDGYEWVWLDSGSLFQDVGLDDIWETVIDEKPSRKRYGLDKQEYGINQFRLGQWVRHMVGGGNVHFGMTAHVMPLPSSLDPDADDKLMPAIAGRVSGIRGGLAVKMCGYMNVVGFLDLTSKGTRILRTQPTTRYYAKDQFDAFPDGKLLKPTMPQIIDLIETARAKRKPAKQRQRSTKRRRSTTSKGR